MNSTEDLRTSLTWKMVSDPLYGYVYFNTEIEEPLINSVLLQRLRYIMQLQTAHYVYPGAVHTRFQHSLGVMHLSGLMAEDAISKVASMYGKDVFEGYEPATLVEAARLAGLLHDVGHASFGHAFEYAVIWRKELPRELSNHEKIGFLLIKQTVSDELEKAETVLPGVRELVYKILGDSPSKGVVSLLRWIVRDGYYPADVLDFLRRDSYYAGTSEYGSIMHERLYKNSYPILEGERFEVVLDRIALGEFRQYMRARASMYEHVYYHSVCRSFDRILYDILHELDSELGLTERVLDVARGRVEGYLELTDSYLYSVMMSKALHERTRLGRLCRKLMIERKPEWKRVGREVSISAYKGVEALKVALRLILDAEYKKRSVEAIEEEVAEELKEFGVSREDVWLDVLEITPLPRATIYPEETGVRQPLTIRVGKKSGKKIVVSEELDIVTEELPIAVTFRAYVPRSKYSLDLEGPATRAVMQGVSKVLGIDVPRASQTVKDLYSDYSSRDYYKFRLTA